MPLVDLQAQYRAIQGDIDAAVRRVLDSSRFILGPEVDSLEREFASWLGADSCVGVSSGTDALYLALRAIGAERGTNVITSPHTFIATAEAITLTGASLRFVDTLPDTYNLDPEEVRSAVDARTRAILPVHLNGHPCRMDELLAIARENDLAVIEDAAQAHGATYHGTPLGLLGDLGCFSFFPGKNLGAYGDAGAVVGKDSEALDRVRLLANHGRSEKYVHQMEGVNARMDAIQAAILRAKLPHLTRWVEQRRLLARQYLEMLGEIEEIHLPIVEPGCDSAWHLFVIRLDRREECISYLHEQGVEAGIHYPIPLHLQPAYSGLGYHRGDFPVTERNASGILTLPLYPEMTEDQQRFVVDCLKNFLATVR